MPPGSPSDTAPDPLQDGPTHEEIYALFDQLNPPGQIDRVAAHIGMPIGKRPSKNNTFDERVTELVDWADRQNVFVLLENHLRRLIADQQTPGEPNALNEGIKSYTKWLIDDLEKQNRVVQLAIGEVKTIPLDAQELLDTESPLHPHDPPQKRALYRTTILREIRRSVRLLAGTSKGGGSANAQLVGLNRKSQVVHDVARLLAKTSHPIILLGDPGMGKSVTLREVALELAHKHLKAARPALILYLRLAEFRGLHDGKPREAEEFVRDHLSRVRPDLKLLPWYKILRDTRRLVLLFDGMDEMERGHYAARVRSLSEFAMQWQGQVRLLFTCRTNDFIPEFIHRQTVLMELNENQVCEYFQKNLAPWPVRVHQTQAPDSSPTALGGTRFQTFADGREIIKYLKREDTELLAFTHNPLQLYLLYHFLKHTSHWPSTRRELYQCFVIARLDLLLHRDDNHLRDVSTDNLHAMWARVAFEITRHNGATTLERHVLVDAIGGAGEMAVDSGLAAGILLLSEENDQAIRFIHHQVQEYLTACHLNNLPDTLSSDQLTSLIDLPPWQETLLHLVSIQRHDFVFLESIEKSMQNIVDQLSTTNATSGTNSEMSADNNQPAKLALSDKSNQSGDENSTETAVSQIKPKASNEQMQTEETSSKSEPAKPAPSRWKLAPVVERQAASRVVLASQIVRELGLSGDRLPQSFRDTFQKCVGLLAKDGRPTTQVRMLLAWKNAAAICPRIVLESAVESETAWVRDQALEVVSRLQSQRPLAGADLRDELLFDFTLGTLVDRHRIWAYAKAMIGSGSVWQLFMLAWAVLCQAAFIVGLFTFHVSGFIALVWVFRFMALSRGWSGILGTGILMALMSLVLGWLFRLGSGRYWWLVPQGMLILGWSMLAFFSVEPGTNINLGVAFIVGFCVLLACRAARQLCYWLSVGIYWLPTLVATWRLPEVGARRRIVNNADLQRDLGYLKFASCLVIFLAGIGVLAWLSQLGGDAFFTAAEWAWDTPATFWPGCFLVVGAVAYRFGWPIGRFVHKEWKARAAERARAWRHPLQSLFLGTFAIALWSWQAIRGFLGCVWIPALGVLIFTIMVLAFFLGPMIVFSSMDIPGEEWAPRTARLGLFAVLIIILGIGLISSWRFLLTLVWRPDVRFRCRPEAWLQFVRTASPHWQDVYIKGVGPEDLGISDSQYHALLVQMENDIADKEHGGVYWQKRQNLEDALCQDAQVDLSAAANPPSASVDQSGSQP